MEIPFFKKELKEPVDIISTPTSDLSETFPDGEWELIARTFTEPKNVTNASEPSLTKIALCGMTTYVFMDKKHNVFKTLEVFGLEQSSLDRLLDKVDIGGPEYILRDGKTYVLLKQPENQQNIPLKK